MRRRGWWIAGVLVLLTNVIVLVGVVSNRSGEPDSNLELTEREVPIEENRDEETGMSLRLDFGSVRRLDWLDRAKLEELGFDCSEPPNAEEAEFHYGKQLPRRGYLVLEHEGEAWRRWLEEQRQEIEETARKLEEGEIEPSAHDALKRNQEIGRLTRSRLFPVDAGSDPRALRERHPDRGQLLILPAVFRISVDRPWNSEIDDLGPPQVVGYVSQLLVQYIHVPLGLAEFLDSHRLERASSAEVDPFEEPEKFEPRFAVTLKAGRRYEPWIDDVRSVD